MADSTIKNLPAATTLETTMSFVVEKADNTNVNIPLSLLDGRYRSISISNANQILKLVTEKYNGNDSVIELFTDSNDVDGSSTGTIDTINGLYKTIGSENLITTDYNFITISQYTLLVHSKSLPSVTADIDGNFDILSPTLLGTVGEVFELDESGVPSANLIHEWLPSNRSGATLPDTAGTADMTITGTVNDVPGPNGAMSALEVRTANSSLCKSTWNPDTTQHTLLFWARSPIGDNRLVGTSLGELVDGFYISASGTSVGFSVFRGSGPNVSSFSWNALATPFDIGEWHQYGVIWNGLNVDIIFDGQIRASGTLSDGWTWNGNTDHPFRYGSLDNSSDTPNVDVEVANCRAYTGALSPSQIADNYNVFIQSDINAYTAESTEIGSTIQLDIEDAEIMTSYTIFAQN